MRDLSAAIFVPLNSDVAAVEEFHSTGGRLAMSPQELREKAEQYWNRRVRRQVRPPAELKLALRAALDKYANCVDVATGLQLLTPLTEQLHGEVLKLIDNGSFCGERSWGLATFQFVWQTCVCKSAQLPLRHGPSNLPPHSMHSQTPSRSTRCTSSSSRARGACPATWRCAARPSWRATTTTWRTCLWAPITPPTWRARSLPTSISGKRLEPAVHLGFVIWF